MKQLLDYIPWAFCEGFTCNSLIQIRLIDQPAGFKTSKARLGSVNAGPASSKHDKEFRWIDAI